MKKVVLTILVILVMCSPAFAGFDDFYNFYSSLYAGFNNGSDENNLVIFVDGSGNLFVDLNGYVYTNR